MGLSSQFFVFQRGARVGDFFLVVGDLDLLSHTLDALSLAVLAISNSQDYIDIRTASTFELQI